MNLELNVHEAGTGAVRSVEVSTERWDLISGYAARKIRLFSNLEDYNKHHIDLLHEADDLIGDFLGGYRDGELERAAFKLLVAISQLDHPSCSGEIRERFREHHYGDFRHVPYWGMIRVATTCHEGATKYGEENWHHGFTVKSLCNHAIRHIRKWISGDNTEDHLGHATWNVMAAIHMFHLHPEMCKLLLGKRWTITPELQAYHDEHASRRRMSKSREQQERTLEGPRNPFANLPRSNA